MQFLQVGLPFPSVLCRLLIHEQAADALYLLTAHPLLTGIYSLDVYCPHYHFPSYKLKLLDASPDAAPAPAETAASITVVEYKYPGAPRIPASYPMLISALAPVQYQLPKAPFSLMGMLMGNPMMLLMVFTGIMAFVMPKMMANMSPEELEELKKQSATSGDPMAKLSKLMSGGGSGKGEPDEDD